MAEIEVGSTVRLDPATKSPAFGFGGVPYESAGTVMATVRIKGTAIHTIFFPEHEHWLGLTEELLQIDEDELVRVNDVVCLRANTRRPRYNWGKVTMRSVGKVRRTHKNGDVIVDFPQQKGWKGYQCELRRCFNGDTEESGPSDSLAVFAESLLKFGDDRSPLRGFEELSCKRNPESEEDTSHKGQPVYNFASVILFFKSKITSILPKRSGPVINRRNMEYHRLEQVA